jgi:hypothetical protein
MSFKLPVPRYSTQLLTNPWILIPIIIDGIHAVLCLYPIGEFRSWVGKSNHAEVCVIEVLVSCTFQTPNPQLLIKWRGESKYLLS